MDKTITKDKVIDNTNAITKDRSKTKTKDETIDVFKTLTKDKAIDNPITELKLKLVLMFYTRFDNECNECNEVFRKK